MTNIMIIDRLIGGPRDGERIQPNLIREGLPLPRTISTVGGEPAAWFPTPTYNYHLRQGIARVGLTRYGLVTAALTRESEDVRFTAWVGQDVSADESMHLIHEMIANDLNGREADRRRGVYDIRRRMAERSRPISNDEIPDDYTARQIFERDEMGHPARPTLHELLDHAAEDRFNADNSGSPFLIDRLADYARADAQARIDQEIDRLDVLARARADTPDMTREGVLDHLAILRAQRAAREERAEWARGRYDRDPMDVYEEINEYLSDSSVGQDAMRCRPRRKP